MRQQISCLVRATLSFSKKLENHIDVFGISSTTIMPAYRLDIAITTYLPLPLNGVGGD